MPSCPQCHYQSVIKNGCIHNGKQRFKCKNCGRQFIENLTQTPIIRQRAICKRASSGCSLLKKRSADCASLMNCGRLSITKAINNGYDLLLMSTLARVSVAYIGKRDRAAAEKLWQSLPAVYRQCAVVYTDCWEAYEGLRHKAVGKDSGRTSYIERLNCKFYQRVSRLVRKTASFSKKIENHVGSL